MIKKIKETLFPTEEQKFQSYVSDYREKNIPIRYNQIKLMEYLTDDDLDHYVSISNRADGKSFNYMGFLLKFSVDYEVGFTFIVRHYTVRKPVQQLIQKIIDTNDHFEPHDFIFMSTDFYTVLIYKDRHVGIITDLNQATDLKYSSNYLQDFPIMIYDEFLALEGDYLMDEWDRLKTIYSSINRKDIIPTITHPKIIYLGNAVNFSSPVLSHLNLFNILEKHPMNETKKYDNIVLEFNRNDNVNEQRNLRAFKEDSDAMTKAEFAINKHNIATGNDRNRINLKPNYVYVKMRTAYLKITYNMDTFESILSVVSDNETYDFNILIKDNTENSTYLTPSYYDEDYVKKYDKDVYLFDNMYSKDNILDGFNDVKTLKISKIIKRHFSDNTKDNFEMREQVYKENYLENTKKNLFKKFFDWLALGISY